MTKKSSLLVLILTLLFVLTLTNFCAKADAAIGVEMLGRSPYVLGRWNSDIFGFRIGFWDSSSDLTSEQQYTASGRYYLQTQGILSPYVGTGFVGGRIYYKGDSSVDGNNPSYGSAIDSSVGVYLPLHKLGLPFVSVTGGANYIHILENEGIRLDEYPNHIPIGSALPHNSGLNFHVSLEFEFSGLL